MRVFVCLMLVGCVLTSEGRGNADEIAEKPSKLGHSPCCKNIVEICPRIGDIEISISIEQILQNDQSKMLSSRVVDEGLGGFQWVFRV